MLGSGEAGHRLEAGQPVAGPDRGVDENPVRHAEQSQRLGRFEVRFGGPPDQDRQVVNQQWRDDPREVLPGFPADGEVDELRAGFRGRLARHDAVGLDLGIEPARPVRIGRRDDQGPRGMASGQALDDRRGALTGLSAAGDHHQVHDAAAGRDMALLVAFRAHRRLGDRAPDPGQLHFDAFDGVGPGRPAEDWLAGLGARGLDDAAGGRAVGHAAQIRRQ